MAVPILRAPTPDDLSSVHYPTTAPSGISSPTPTSTPQYTPPLPANTPTSATPTSSQNNAYAYLQSVLRLYGLDSLSSWAWDQIIAGNSPEMTVQLLYERPEFRQRFPAIEARRLKGLPPISVNQILDYEQNVRELHHQWGFMPGFNDSAEAIQTRLADDVSIQEYAERIQLAAQDYFSLDPISSQELRRLYPVLNGLSPVQMVQYIMDSGTALPLIRNQISASALSAASVRSTYGQLTAQEAESLAGIGVNPGQAQSTFSSLAQSHELFTPLPGEQADLIARGEQIRAGFFGDAVAQTRLANRAGSRIAQFRGGGKYAGGTRGLTGLGTLDR